MRFLMADRMIFFFSAHSTVPIARNSIALNYSGESLIWRDREIQAK